MKVLGCLFMLVVGIILAIVIVGWNIIRSLLGLKGGPSVMFKTMKDIHQNVKNVQEQMKTGTSQEQESKAYSRDTFYNETSQERTDTTSPGARKVIPDDEGEYVSYEEIKNDK